MSKIELKLPTSIGKFRTSLAMILGLVGAAAVLLASVWSSITQYIAPDEFAIRQVYLGPNKGVHEEVIGPGIQLVLPGYERLHVFPRDMQSLDLNATELSSWHSDRLEAPPIVIQTSEGFKVTVDVTVLYRIVDPYTVVTKVGAGRLYESKIVVRRSDKILRETFGELNAEEFYSDTIRMAKAEQARMLLQDDLSNWGIQVWAVLIRNYHYDERYQEAIEQRKIQDQKVYKAQAEGLAASRAAERERVIAEGRAKIEVELEAGRTEVRKIAADADLYYRQRVAEGELLVALAEAEGARLEKTALEQAGGSNIVGIEMAKALDGTEVIVISTTGQGAMNPLDLDALLGGW